MTPYEIGVLLHYYVSPSDYPSSPILMQLGEWEDLPQGTFANTGTMVNSALLTIKAPL